MSARSAPLRLEEVSRCFQGVIPSLFATSSRQGVPNVVYVSQIHRIDERHVAISRQFFNKTSRNLDENPRSTAEVYDPVTMEAYRLRLRLLRSEKSGPLFDAMSIRIDAIASMTGMTGVFRLIAADVFEVERLEQVEGFLVEGLANVPREPMSLEGLRTELRGVQWISDRINRSENLESLLSGVLEALDTYFSFRHTMILLPDETRGKLVTIASRGYGVSGVGAEVPVGEGLIGTVARERRVLRITGLEASLRYGRAIRREASVGAVRPLHPEVALPGLPDAQSALVIPLAICERLVGVLAAESRDSMGFGEWHEAYLEVIGNQIALGIDRMAEVQGEEEELAAPAAPAARPPARNSRHSFVYYRNEDCVFVDDEYLVKYVPGRILWKLLGEWQRRGRTEFTNRELRVDPSLGLPAVKDNLESRLILLRHRLQEKCPAVRIVPTGRGRFAFQVEADVQLAER